MIAVRVPSLMTNTEPLVDVSLIRISLPGPSIMNRGRLPAKSMYSSTTNPGGAMSLASSGFGATVGLLRTDGVANGAGSSFQFTGLRLACAWRMPPNSGGKNDRDGQNLVRHGASIITLRFTNCTTSGNCRESTKCPRSSNSK